MEDRFVEREIRTTKTRLTRETGAKAAALTRMEAKIVCFIVVDQRGN